jgi:hypothetical protein
MDDPQNPGPPSGAPEQVYRAILLDPADAARVRARKIIVWRLCVLLSAAVIAFALTVWFLVRMDLPAGSAGEELAAANVVRTQLDALNRGDLREAYDLFSQRYRDQVPFEAFHDLVATHLPMFRARKVDFESHEESHARAVLDTHILSTNGERYFARYTVIRIEGHWWIDDIRWGPEPQPPSRTTAFLAPPAIPFDSLPHFHRRCG